MENGLGVQPSCKMISSIMGTFIVYNYLRWMKVKTKVKQCDGCGRHTSQGPPYIDYIVEMTNSHDPRELIYFCNLCESDFYAWQDSVHLASIMDGEGS